jgi:NADH-ubiquinone oxidoreductase chain 1
VLVFLSGTFNLSIIIEVQKAVYFILLAFPLFMIFYVAGVAETNRAPFDLAEAESELVSGFMTEHAAGIFVFFFLAEYASIILICILISIIFLGGYEILGFIYNIQELFINIIYYIYIFSIYTINTITSMFNYSNSINPIIYEDFINLFSLNNTYIINNNILSILNPSGLSIKSLMLVFLFILVRASYPRLRFDKLMSYC